MANMVLLKIGNTDVTAWLDRQNCQFNETDVFESWIDGNGLNHRNVSRTQITGKAVAGFSKTADFSAFRTLIEGERQTDGFFNVTAYINNTGETKVFQAFIDIVATAKWDWLNSRQWHVLTLNVTER